MKVKIKEMEKFVKKIEHQHTAKEKVEFMSLKLQQWEQEKNDLQKKINQLQNQSNQTELEKSTTIESRSEYIERLERKIELLKEYKKDNEKMVKYIKLLEKDLGIGANEDPKQRKAQIQIHHESRPKYKPLSDHSYTYQTRENTYEYYQTDPLTTYTADPHFSTVDSSYPSSHIQPPSRRRYHKQRSSSQVFPNHLKPSLNSIDTFQRGTNFF